MVITVALAPAPLKNTQSENKQQQQKKENDDPLSKYILTQTKYFSKTVSQTVLNLAELFN